MCETAIPNRHDFMHKLITPGVHEIASLVVKTPFIKSLGTVLPAVRIVRPEREATIVPRPQRLPSVRIVSFAENSSGLPSVRIVSFAEDGSGLTASRSKCFAFSPRRGIHGNSTESDYLLSCEMLMTNKAKNPGCRVTSKPTTREFP